MQIQFTATLTAGSNVVTATGATDDLSGVTAGSLFVPSVAPPAGGAPYTITIQNKVAPGSGNGNRWQLLLAANWAGASATGVQCAAHVDFTPDGQAVISFNDAGAIALINFNTTQKSGLYSQVSAAAAAAQAAAAQALSTVQAQDQSVPRDYVIGRDLSVSRNGLISGNLTLGGIGNFGVVQGSTATFTSLVVGTSATINGALAANSISSNTSIGGVTGSFSGAVFVGGALTGPTITALQAVTGNNQSVTVGASGLVSQTFPIVAGYRAFRLVVAGRCDAAADTANVMIQFNGDTAANYQSELLYVTATGAPAGSQNAGSAGMSIGALPGTQNAAGYQAIAEVRVPNYAATAFYKQVLARGGNYTLAGGGATVRDITGSWNSQAAVASVKVFLSNGNFLPGTTISLIYE